MLPVFDRNRVYLAVKLWRTQFGARLAAVSYHGPGMYHVLADLVLLTHLAFVAFVVMGLVLIWCGGCLGWRWVRNPWFRHAHLLAIGVVVMQAWLGVVCPLTTLEMALRERAGDLTYEGTFIAHWLQRLLFYDAPAWCFTLGYTLFGLAVVAGWIWIRPRPFRTAGKAATRR